MTMADKWQVQGTLFEACNCHSSPCPCAYFLDPTGDDCRTSAVWHIEKGSMGATKLDGLNVAGLWYIPESFTKGVDKSVVIADEKANTAQRKALAAIFGGKAGGLFGGLSKMVRHDLGVVYAKFEYKNDGKSWSVKAGDTLDVAGGIIEAPPGFGIETMPRVAQTYDFLYEKMEKTVGIADHLRANAAGVKVYVKRRGPASGRV